ncbi:MAG TPA: Smr/MutS family protein, partial [Prolixibacteraceae bacterium]|nr:Smr/MutS family protein [Prolixibacteraceae bacterium]
GTGTEPMLGGAIAESILKRLNELQTFGVITTHYTNLKHFASSTPGVVNGAMLYDSHKMDPLFRLEIGKPGSSFAFEIARKIGLPEEILQEATEKVGKKHIDFDKNLRSITRDKHYWETKRQKIHQVEKNLDQMAGQYEKELQEIRQLRKEILSQAKEEARQLLNGVNKTIENTVREIREAQAEKERTKNVRKQLETLKETVTRQELPEDVQIAKKMEKLLQREKRRNQNRPESQTTKTGAPKPAPETLSPGDKVRIKGQDTTGELIELSDKNAVVAFGQLITTLPVKNVEKVSNNEAKKIQREQKQPRSSFLCDLSERRLSFKPEIDIRGQRAEEAIANIQTFIDEAIMFEVGQLRILHGKGHGILKEMIRAYLKSEPMVASFQDEHVQFGGAGITVVQLAL